MERPGASITVSRKIASAPSRFLLLLCKGKFSLGRYLSAYRVLCSFNYLSDSEFFLDQKTVTAHNAVDEYQGTFLSVCCAPILSCARSSFQLDSPLHLGPDESTGPGWLRRVPLRRPLP